MPAVPVSETKQIIPKPDINDIILAKGTKVLLALDIEPFYFIEEIAFHQRVYIRLNRVCARSSFPFTIFQQPLVHQGIANG